MKVIIIAGGKGTRLKDIAKDIPKPMVPINGKPILEYQIELAKRYGLTDILILTGHLGEQIRDYFGTGARWGVMINYFQETTPLGTAGCFREIEQQLTEDFFVFYGDTVMDVALDKMITSHKKNKAQGTLFLHPNDHPYDSDLVEINEKKQVTRFFPKPHEPGYYRNLVNAALYILSPQILKYIPRGQKSDFGKNIFPAALSAGEKLFGYVSPEYVKDMGTPDRYDKVSNDLISGKVTRLNLNNPRPAIFLDRDGVINKEVDLIHTPEQLALLPGVAEAIQKINAAGYLAVVVTNQPVIARNLCSLEELQVIHNKLETLLGEQHAYVDAIYFCPHHPDKGYPEERKEYKIDCNCRKPKPGMLLQAAQDLHIDLKNSYMIGDRESDIQAGTAAGVKEAILVPANVAYNLLKTIEKIVEKK
jgi:D,D-heptose 1,7-bisphosphate phosphatase